MERRMPEKLVVLWDYDGTGVDELTLAAGVAVEQRDRDAILAARDELLYWR
jgi:hypothetical protein